jgi:hypothetical protein
MLRTSVDVRYTPQSGRRLNTVACPLSAKSGHMLRSKTASLFSIRHSAGRDRIGGNNCQAILAARPRKAPRLEPRQAPARSP